MSNNKSDSENDDISGPRPRLCHLRKWPHFQGYGFNLHAEKTRNGQSIGKVDPNSPAESAGLKEKDRIIEVNFVNISNENHQQVVKRIRCGLEINGQLSENEVVLLVVDPEADEYYKKRNIVVKHDFKNVLKLETPSEEAYLNNNNNNSNNNNNTKLLPPDSSPHVSSHRNSVSSTSEHNNSTEINNNNFDKTSNDYRYTNTNTSQNNEKVSTPLSQDKSLNYEKVSPPQTPLSTKSNGSVSSSNKDTQSNKSSSTTNTMNNNNNNHHSSNNANPFNMSAAEYKAYLKSNKPKSDPRSVHVDIKQKYQIFQNM